MTDTDDDLRAAREWLREAYNDQYEEEDNVRHTQTILRRLDMPVMPGGSEVPDDVIVEMWDAYRGADVTIFDGMRAALNVLYAHLTAPPKQKREEGWLVIDGADRASFTSKGVALAYAKDRPGSRLVRLVEAADADA